MARKCPECLEGGDRPHLSGCSYAPDRLEREAFIRENAVALVRDLEARVRRQAKALTSTNNGLRNVRAERGRLRESLRRLGELIEADLGRPGTDSGYLLEMQALVRDALKVSGCLS